MELESVLGVGNGKVAVALDSVQGGDPEAGKEVDLFVLRWGGVRFKVLAN